MLSRLRNAVLNTLVRRGVETALQATAEVAATATARAFRQVFPVGLPTTVYVRASQCEVKIQHQPGNHVELVASLQASFGWEFVAEQDDAGVYIVARRKPVVGALSRASVTLIVPPEANLVFHLTPGAVRLMNVDGKLSIPAFSEQG
jgi:hypothetical protein